MGEFLEENWAEDFFLDPKSQPHEGSSSAFYFASMASGMTRLMHEMQVERGLSCRAVAAAAEQKEKAKLEKGTLRANECDLRGAALIRR